MEKHPSRVFPRPAAVYVRIRTSFLSLLLLLLSFTLPTANPNQTMAHASPEEVKAAAEDPGAIILDVRTKEEVAEASLTSRPFKHCSCTLEDCSELMSKAEEYMPDKNGEL